MKIICEKRREIEVTKSCRKEYCCKKMKEAMENYPKTHNPYSSYDSDLKLQGNSVILETHHDYDGCCGHEMQINYCPFCGTKITIEKQEVDNTGLPPIQPLKKKKHWWN